MFILHTSLYCRSEDESHEDSGLASSFEENMVLGDKSVGSSNGGGGKTKRKVKKRTKHFEMSNDLIFDLDI